MKTIIYHFRHTPTIHLIAFPFVFICVIFIFTCLSVVIGYEHSYILHARGLLPPYEYFLRNNNNVPVLKMQCFVLILQRIRLTKCLSLSQLLVISCSLNGCSTSFKQRFGERETSMQHIKGSLSKAFLKSVEKFDNLGL